MTLQPKETPKYLEAKAMLPPEMHERFAGMVEEYRFSSLKHHGIPFASPKVIAELILMGWRNDPEP